MKFLWEVVSKAIKLGPAVAPADRGATSVTTSGIDRLRYNEVLVFVNTGAASGAPTAINLSVDLEHSDNGTTFVPFASRSGVVTAANGSGFAAFDVLGAKRFVRAKLNVGFTGGTSPSVLCGAQVVLAGSANIPAE